MYEPTSTLLVDESEVHPSDCQAAEADDEDEAVEEVLEAVDDVLELEEVVFGAAVVVAAEEDEEVEEEEGVAEDAAMRASFWNTLTLYPPPQTVF